MEPSAPVLPTQVTPPGLVLSETAAHFVDGVEVLALPVLPAGDEDTGPVLGPGAEELSTLLGVDLLALVESEKATGAVGEVVRLPVPLGTEAQPSLRTVLLLGVGDLGTTALRRAGSTLARATKGRATVATAIAALADDDGLEAFAVGVVLGSFSFSWRSTPQPDAAPAERVVLAGCAPARQPALDRALAVAGAGWRARFLATVPSNLKNPAWLAEQAREVAEGAGLGYRVWDEQQLAAEGFGGILGVGQGSASPPRLVRLDYAPKRASRRTPTVVLVGKGITFDTGGYSIKPGEAMATMKRDMTGAGVVLATMAALGAVGCPVKVVGLLACAENSVSGTAMRPGDVLRHYGGRTTEVTNTDAEGRLVMADALAYAVAELSPAALVDVATLTGAIKVALGQRTGGFFADDEALATALSEAGTRAGEPLWRFPLASVYEERLASKVADADNAAGGPGAITAALFLQHFTGDVPWAHLDIASVGDSPGESFEWTTGPSGFGARTLLTWLGSEDPLAGIGS